MPLIQANIKTPHGNPMERIHGMIQALAGSQYTLNIELTKANNAPMVNAPEADAQRLMESGEEEKLPSGCTISA